MDKLFNMLNGRAYFGVQMYNSFYIVLVTAENLDFDITNGFWMSMSAIYNYQLSGLANLKLNKRPSIIRLDDSLHRWSIDQFM